MALDIIITLTTVGIDQGALFNLYSNTDGFNTPYEVDVPYGSLTTGYTTSAPDYTETVRVCGQDPKCINCVDINPSYTTTTTTSLPPVECGEVAESGGVGVTEFGIPLETVGGVLVLDFEAFGVVDKMEILHNGIKVATSGMTTVNAGPFDDLYGDPTVPTPAEANLVDQFIGTAKGTPPSRDAEIFAETGYTFTSSLQQLVWFTYDDDDVVTDPYAIVRVTGPTGTAWNFKRLCDETTTTTTTSSSTTTTTTSSTTTTTTTTLAPFSTWMIAASGEVDPNDSCAEFEWPSFAYSDLSPLGIGSTLYSNTALTNVFLGGDYYWSINYEGVFLINNSGVIVAQDACTTTTTTTVAVDEYCYIGIYNNPDPAHPLGGSVTYVDGVGDTVIQKEIYDDAEVTIWAQEILNATGAIPCPVTTTTTTTSGPSVFYLSNPSGLSSCDSGVAADSIQVSADKSPQLLIVGDKIYADISGSGPGYPGNSTSWYNVTVTLGFKIDSGGFIIDIDDCGIPI